MWKQRINISQKVEETRDWQENALKCYMPCESVVRGGSSDDVIGYLYWRHLFADGSFDILSGTGDSYWPIGTRVSLYLPIDEASRALKLLCVVADQRNMRVASEGSQ